MAALVAAGDRRVVVMELGPGFTWEGFGANVAVEFFSASFGMLAALAVALVVYGKTRDDQWAIFKSEVEVTRKARDEEEQAQRTAIRLALHREVADNLRRLQEFWPRVVVPGEEDTAEKVARRLVHAAVPVWTMGIWQGAAATVAVALPIEQLTETYRLYTTLAEILETQHRLQAALDSDAVDYGGQPVSESFMTGVPAHKNRATYYFEGAANRLIPDLANRVESILERGTPIPMDPELSEPPARYS